MRVETRYYNLPLGPAPVTDASPQSLRLSALSRALPPSALKRRADGVDRILLLSLMWYDRLSVFTQPGSDPELAFQTRYPSNARPVNTSKSTFEAQAVPGFYVLSDS